MRFSRRTEWRGPGNRVTAALEERRRGRVPLRDLTESNPTRAGLAWRTDVLAAALGDPRVAVYEPDPGGLPAARAEVVRYLAARGAVVDPSAVLLTASTSEAYAMVLKLLCDPGDAVLVPAPTYPLHEVLCQLEGVRARSYPLRYDGRWHVDVGALAAAITEDVRAVVVVSPGNPTGAVVGDEELAAIEQLCARNRIALVGDEVFADVAAEAVPSVASVRRCLAFHLAGLSKTCGLPQLKAAWMALAGPGEQVRAALERLEQVCDASLSLSTPAALALTHLLPRREEFLAAARARLDANHRHLRSLARTDDPFDVLPRAGGWSAVVRLPETVDEEALCLAVLEAGVVVQPGFFYDFERNGYLILSLMTEEASFRDGAAVVFEEIRNRARS